MKKSIHEFSFTEMTSNADGKTSGSGTMGVIICFVGSLCFLLGCLCEMFMNKTATNIITQSILFVGIGAGLLGYRKSKSDMMNLKSQIDETNLTTSDEKNNLEKNDSDPSMDPE